MIINGIYPAFYDNRPRAPEPALVPVQLNKTEVEMLKDIILVRMGVVPAYMTKAYYDVLHRKMTEIFEEYKKENNAH